MSTSPLSVAILLATHQGREFLPAQLDSIASQTHTNWHVWASDDSSSDGTRRILEDYQTKWGRDRLTILNGPGLGADENFRSLIGNDAIEADAFAFADQDDVWVDDKLERAARWIAKGAAGQPALYCSRTRLIDGNGHVVGLSPLFARPPSFANALVQNIAGGNTMVFNRAARELWRQALPASARVVIYDWWTYLIVGGAGGRVFYDPEPTVCYRQHGRNLVGANVRLPDRARGLGLALLGRLRNWNDRHVDALTRIEALLTEDSRARLAQFRRARTRWLVPRLVGLKRAGVYRQTTLGNAGLALAAVLNRV